MTSNDTDWEFEELSTSGTFATFKSLGDSYTGRIEQFSLDGGTDFDGNPVPLLVLATVDGTVKITGSQASLRRQMTELATRLTVGHGCKVTYDSDYETKHGTKGKSFAVAVTPKPVAPIVPTYSDDEAPF
jgi:hypothetical protein